MQKDGVRIFLQYTRFFLYPVVHQSLLLTVVGRSIFLRACTAVPATSTDQHGRVDQPCNQHLIHLLCRRHHRHNDCRREHRPKDVLWDSADVADLRIVRPVAGTHCQGALFLSRSLQLVYVYSSDRRVCRILFLFKYWVFFNTLALVVGCHKAYPAYKTVPLPLKGSTPEKVKEEMERNQKILFLLENDRWDGLSGILTCTLSLIHIWRCRRSYACRSRWSPYH